MFKLVHIRLDNFRGRKDFELNFAEENVTIMHGINGSGKTTLLRIIHGILSMNEAIITNENIKEATLILLEKATNEYKYVLVRFSEEDDSEFSWFTDIDNIEDLHENFSSLVFGVNRGLTFNTSLSKVSPIDIHKMIREFDLRFRGDVRSIRSSLMLEEITEFLNVQVRNRSKRLQRAKSDIDLEVSHLMIDNLSMSHVEILLNEKYLVEKKIMSDKVQNALFETLAQVLDSQNNLKKGFEVIPQDLNIKLTTYRETLLDLLSDLEGNELSKRIINAIRNYDSSTTIPFEGNETISNLVYNMITELEKGKVFLNTVTQLVDEFNNYLDGDKKLVIDERGARIETSENSHGIEKLSSGERHLLSFLTLFIIEGSTRDILMIDEPEISLNLEWQGKLLNMLTKFAPRSQIIVATHSPAIAEYNTNSLVEIG